MPMISYKNPKPKSGYRVYNVQGKDGPTEVLEDESRCIESIYDVDGIIAFYPRQCSRKRGYGPHGFYCKQHAKRVWHVY